MTRSGARKHWTADMGNRFHSGSSRWQHQRELTRWIGEKLNLTARYRGATGILRSNSYRAMVSLKRVLRGVPIGLWLEHPNFAVPRSRRMVMEAAIRVQLRTIDYVLAIGDRAERFYRQCHPSLPIHVVPYGQDLGPLLEVERSTPTRLPTFLFSGQLVHRIYIDGLCAAIRKLAVTHTGRFRFIMAAYGPEEERVRALMREVPSLNEAITFDTEYETWNDRIRPFPMRMYSLSIKTCGMGACGTEAMAAGMPVIATRYVAARYSYARK